MEKYLILKLDESSMLHLPERISETPYIFDTTIPEDKIQEYSQVKLTGSAWDIKSLEDILFSKYENRERILVNMRQVLDNLSLEEQTLLKEKFGFLKEFDKLANEFSGEGIDNQSSVERISNNS